MYACLQYSHYLILNWANPSLTPALSLWVLYFNPPSACIHVLPMYIYGMCELPGGVNQTHWCQIYGPMRGCREGRAAVWVGQHAAGAISLPVSFMCRRHSSLWRQQDHRTMKTVCLWSDFRCFFSSCSLNLSFNLN